LTSNEIIEVKNSYSAWSPKPKQVEKFVNTSNPQYFNPYQKRAILYIDTPLSTVQRNDILSKIPSNVTLVNSLTELNTVLR